jgi:hypothetical protein
MLVDNVLRSRVQCAEREALPFVYIYASHQNLILGLLIPYYDPGCIGWSEGY